jgi:hypothetical protein
MLEKNIRDAYVSPEDVKRARQQFVREYAATMSWDANNLNEQQLEQIQRQAGWRSAGLLKS